MNDGRSARFALRDATAIWHSRVDAVFSKVDLSDRGGYGRFLLAQASAHIPVEQALEAAGIADVLTDWPSRRRCAFVLEDLATLGLSQPELEHQPLLKGVPGLLGAVYVLEGSRLGGAMLKRSVAADLPMRFLSAQGSSAWRDLIAVIDERLLAKDELGVAIEAACTVFALFERCGRRLIV